ncbi:MAG: ankyrin repeat domain-containing protein [Pseudomonadota bacterium]
MQIKTFLLPLLCLALSLSGCSEPKPPTINLYRAVHIGDIDQIERNLFWDAKVNQPGPDGLTALHVAAKKGDLVVVKMLLKHGADIDASDRDGYSPLQTALLARNSLVAGYLVKQNARLDANAILREAVRLGQADRDVIDFLAKQGAELDSPDEQGNTPLHIAILNGHRVNAKYLVEKGADIDLADRSGRTPLELAIERGEADIERMLRQFGASSKP